MYIFPPLIIHDLSIAVNFVTYKSISQNKNKHNFFLKLFFRKITYKITSGFHSKKNITSGLKNLGEFQNYNNK